MDRPGEFAILEGSMAGGDTGMAPHYDLVHADLAQLVSRML